MHLLVIFLPWQRGSFAPICHHGKTCVHNIIHETKNSQNTGLEWQNRAQSRDFQMRARLLLLLFSSIILNYCSSSVMELKKMVSLDKIERGYKYQILSADDKTLKCYDLSILKYTNISEDTMYVYLLQTLSAILY